MSIWDEIAPEFSRSEFNDPDGVNEDLLRRMHRARVRSGVPFRIVSDKRPPGIGAENSAHEDGLAIDIRALNNEERYWLTIALMTVDLPDSVWQQIRDGQAGFQRLGMYAPNEHQIETYGKRSGSIHFDCAMDRPHPRIWMSY
ncbi:MAG: hypothetical protein QGD93_02630 [Actinomycetota bacterium]|nr:hypothetical protein [Actinomycetota bacterium]